MNILVQTCPHCGKVMQAAAPVWLTTAPSPVVAGAPLNVVTFTVDGIGNGCVPVEPVLVGPTATGVNVR